VDSRTLIMKTTCFKIVQILYLYGCTVILGLIMVQDFVRVVDLFSEP